MGIDKIARTFIPNLTCKDIVKKLLSPLFILVILVGCNNEKTELTFEDIALDQVSETNCVPEEENCAFISVHTPMADNTGNVSQVINQHIEQHIISLVDYQEEEDIKSLEALVQKFMDNYESSAKEFPEYNIPWEASVEGEMVNETPEVISIKYKLALFTGGAHGYTSITFLNFDPETGDLLKNEQIFNSEFKAYAEKLFRKKNDIPEDGSINSTGFFFENDQFQLPQNIGILKNKIILRYNAYEVASYAEGGIQLEIPMEKAEEYIKIL